MKYIFLLISFLYIHLDSIAQNKSSCSTAQKLMTEATKIENQKTPNYGDAIRKLYSAQIAARDCSPAKETEVKGRIINLFEKIEKLRVAAEEAKNKAIKSEEKAKIATTNASALFWASEANKYNSIQGLQLLQFVKKTMSKAEYERNIQIIKNATESVFNNSFVDKFTLIKSKTLLPISHLKDINMWTSPSFSENGKWMIVNYSDSPDSYRIVNASRQNKHYPLDKEYPISSFFFSENQRWLLTEHSTQPNELGYKLWNLEDGKSQNYTYKGKKIKTAKFSLNGRWLATTDIVNQTIIWDLNSNKHYLSLPNVISIDFSFDCKWIITSSDCNEKCIYKLNDRDRPSFLKNNTYNHIAITDNCRWIITRNDNYMYQLWDINTGKEATFISKSDSTPILTLSSKNNWLVAKYKNYCQIWNLSNIQSYDFLKNEIDIADTKFSVEGSMLITFHSNAHNKVWNLKSREPLTFLKNEMGITNVQADSNFNYVVITYGKKIIKVWDIKKEIQILKERSIHKYAFSNYGTLILALNKEQLYQINLKNKNETLFDLPKFNDSNFSMYRFGVISPDFRWLGSVIETRTDYELWDLKHVSEQIEFMLKHEENIRDISFSPDSKWLVTSSSTNYSTKVWSMEKGMEIDFLKQERNIDEVSFSSDSKWMVARDFNDPAKVWSMDNKRELDFLKQENKIRDATFSPDSKWLVTTYSNNTAKVWSTEKEIQADFLKDEATIINATFSPDSKWLVTTYSNNTAKVWSTEKEIQADFLKDEATISYATFSPDSKWLITRDGNDNSKVWSVETGKYYDFLKDEKMISDPTFSPDSKWLITSNRGNFIYKVWSVETGKYPDFLKDEKTIRYPTFSPDSKWLITRDGNDNSKVWSVETGKYPDFLKDEKNISWVKFSPDSKWLITRNENYNSKVWSVETGKYYDFLKDEKNTYKATFSQDAKLLSIITQHQVKTYEVATGKLIQTLWLNKEPYRINIIDNRYLYVTVGKAIVKTDLETQRGNLMSYGDGEPLDYEYDEIQQWIKVFGDKYLLPLDEEIKNKYGIKD